MLPAIWLPCGNQALDGGLLFLVEHEILTSSGKLQSLMDWVCLGTAPSITLAETPFTTLCGQVKFAFGAAILPDLDCLGAAGQTGSPRLAVEQPGKRQLQVAIEFRFFCRTGSPEPAILTCRRPALCLQARMASPSPPLALGISFSKNPRSSAASGFPAQLLGFAPAGFRARLFGGDQRIGRIGNGLRLVALLHR
jgi:hypothetical protein